MSAASKTEEAIRAVVIAIVPFLLALAVIWYVPGLNRFPLKAAHPELKIHDYRLILSSLYSETVFTQNTEAFWQALDRTLPRQSLFLFWYYLLAIVTAVGLGYLAGAYGDFRGNRHYRWFADKLLFPRISEWHPLLTPFVFTDKQTLIHADILTTNDTLYRGRISDHFIDSAGKLTGMILTEAKRFDRRSYLRDIDANRQVRTDDYWREIPGAKLYMFADKIVNLNLSYESAEPDEQALVRFLSERLKRPVRIQVHTRRRSD